MPSEEQRRNQHAQSGDDIEVVVEDDEQKGREGDGGGLPETSSRAALKPHLSIKSVKQTGDSSDTPAAGSFNVDSATSGSADEETPDSEQHHPFHGTRGKADNEESEAVRETKAFLSKWKGKPGAKSPPRASDVEVAVASIGGFVGIGSVAALHFHLPFNEQVVIASFAASAVLLYGAPNAPLAQPRNFILGHYVSALTGIVLRFFLYHLLEDHSENLLGLFSGIGCGLSIFLMMMTKSLHPPGAATTLIVLWLKPDLIDWHGFWFLIFPLAPACAIMLLVALIVNNVPESKRYPQWWW
eukprot:gb/GECG01010624.1/.p1 GENE.gb/GECG01010624.1/~~gb/GECG01010624.1/.p1  ORF type:complete len:299 (+),score=39.02 gb/GECG01010624.1/:1-897(+)